MAKSEIALLTGGGDRPYAHGLAMALMAKGICLDFIGSDELDSVELRESPGLTFLNLRGSQEEDAGFVRKVSRVAMYYARLIRYASASRPKVLHILWNNRFELFDRTVLMGYYRLRGKRVALTVHNVNAGRRDSHDSLLNRLSLGVQYRLADHIFVHTKAMKSELVEDFAVREQAVTVIPLGFNNSVPDTDLSHGQARRRLGIGDAEKVILFFGRISPYKGVEFLVAAFQRVMAQGGDYRLIIAGKPERSCEKYVDKIRQAISSDGSRERVIQRMEFIRDEETEVYFKAADVFVLPYTEVFQSGVLILGYGFGLPVIATDVGSFGEEIIEGETGFLCRTRDSVDLARTIEAYFQSDLFKALSSRRPGIREYARTRYSWETVSEATRAVYAKLLAH
jgi:glycosyltransferase involved in cell wall biosynthesis